MAVDGKPWFIVRWLSHYVVRTTSVWWLSNHGWCSPQDLSGFWPVMLYVYSYHIWISLHLWCTCSGWVWLLCCAMCHNWCSTCVSTAHNNIDTNMASITFTSSTCSRARLVSNKYPAVRFKFQVRSWLNLATSHHVLLTWQADSTVSIEKLGHCS